MVKEGGQVLERMQLVAAVARGADRIVAGDDEQLLAVVFRPLDQRLDDEGVREFALLVAAAERRRAGELLLEDGSGLLFRGVDDVGLVLLEKFVERLVEVCCDGIGSKLCDGAHGLRQRTASERARRHAEPIVRGHFRGDVLGDARADFADGSKFLVIECKAFREKDGL
jgi:hypothetical protein